MYQYLRQAVVYVLRSLGFADLLCRNYPIIFRCFLFQLNLEKSPVAGSVLNAISELGLLTYADFSFLLCLLSTPRFFSLKISPRLWYFLVFFGKNVVTTLLRGAFYRYPFGGFPLYYYLDLHTAKSRHNIITITIYIIFGPRHNFCYQENCDFCKIVMFLLFSSKKKFVQVFSYPFRLDVFHYKNINCIKPNANTH